MNGIARTVFISLAFGLCTKAALGIVNGYPAPDERRFDAVAAFGNFETMTSCNDPIKCGCLNTFGNGTLVQFGSDPGGRWMLMCRHTGIDTLPCDSIGNPDLPPQGFAFRFRRRPDGGLATPTDCSSFYYVKPLYFVTAHADVAGGCPDIVLAYLEEDVSAWIAPIPFDPTLSVAVGDPVIEAGWGLDESGYHQGQLRLCDGHAVVAGCGAIQVAGDDGCTVAYFDSGGAFLVETASGFRIVGVITTLGGGGVDAHVMLIPDYQFGFCCIDPQLPQHPEDCADFNQDGTVNAADLLMVINNSGPCPDCANCPMDINEDCQINTAELLLVINSFGHPCIPPCPGDFAYNNVVNNGDLLQVINHWGSCTCPWCPDGNHDGVVNAADLLIVTNNWGPCP